VWEWHNKLPSEVEELAPEFRRRLGWKEKDKKRRGTRVISWEIINLSSIHS